MFRIFTISKILKISLIGLIITFFVIDYSFWPFFELVISFVVAVLFGLSILFHFWAILSKPNYVLEFE